MGSPIMNLVNVSGRSAALPVQVGPRFRPFLFLHIPKTAGTSLITLLGNIFGERHIHRLRDNELETSAVNAFLTSPAMDNVRCLVGHFPVHAFAGRFDEFKAFSVLRDPVERVMSLYRFLRTRSPADLARMGLSTDFTFDEFIESRSPEIFGQVHNGMCRLLSGIGQFGDSQHESFWKPSLPDNVVEASVTTLHGIDFGLTERMSDTLAVLQTMLATPSDLVEHVENASKSQGSARTTRNVRRIVEYNTADIALYQEACALFHSRMARLDVTRAAGSVLAPRLLVANDEIALCDLPGRQGFHAFETATGFAWLLGTQPAKIAFAANPGIARLRLRVYRISANYPAEEVRLMLNEVEAPVHWEEHENRWGAIETEPLAMCALNLLTLQVPYAVPARFLSPDTPDERQLSIAVAGVMLSA